jgi:pimeloyl-ACP methyl ester carboxylesterase
MEPRTCQVGAETIAYYETAGTGPAALLVHGNSASGLAYARQLSSPLGEKFRLVAIDLPGHGLSARASTPESVYTLPGYARVVAGIARQLGMEDAVFVGWSLGGHIVLEATDQLPHARGFMIFGTPPLAYPPAMGEAFLPHPAMAYTFQRDLADEEAEAYVAAFFKPQAATIPESFRADCKRTDGRARETLGGSIAPGLYRDEVQVVENLKVPLAILHGEHEQLVNLDYFKRLNAPTLWHGAVQMVPDSGHAAHWENPVQFNALLEAFITETAA